LLFFLYGNNLNRAVLCGDIHIVLFDIRYRSHNFGRAVRSHSENFRAAAGTKTAADATFLNTYLHAFTSFEKIKTAAA
jgi:hypothetical protein